MDNLVDFRLRQTVRASIIITWSNARSLAMSVPSCIAFYYEKVPQLITKLVRIYFPRNSEIICLLVQLLHYLMVIKMQPYVSPRSDARLFYASSHQDLITQLTGTLVT
jgi:hypothetical protein